MQTNFLEGLCILKGLRFSHYFKFIPLTDNRNSKIHKGKQFYLEFGCIKIQYEHRETNKCKRQCRNDVMNMLISVLRHLATLSDFSNWL